MCARVAHAGVCGVSGMVTVGLTACDDAACRVRHLGTPVCTARCTAGSTCRRCCQSGWVMQPPNPLSLPLQRRPPEWQAAPPQRRVGAVGLPRITLSPTAQRLDGGAANRLQTVRAVDLPTAGLVGCYIGGRGGQAGAGLRREEERVVGQEAGRKGFEDRGRRSPGGRDGVARCMAVFVWVDSGAEWACSLMAPAQAFMRVEASRALPMIILQCVWT